MSQSRHKAKILFIRSAIGLGIALGLLMLAVTWLMIRPTGWSAVERGAAQAEARLAARGKAIKAMAQPASATALIPVTQTEEAPRTFNDLLSLVRKRKLDIGKLTDLWLLSTVRGGPILYPANEPRSVDEASSPPLRHMIKNMQQVLKIQTESLDSLSTHSTLLRKDPAFWDAVKTWMLAGGLEKELVFDGRSQALAGWTIVREAGLGHREEAQALLERLVEACCLKRWESDEDFEDPLSFMPVLLWKAGLMPLADEAGLDRIDRMLEQTTGDDADWRARRSRQAKRWAARMHADRIETERPIGWLEYTTVNFLFGQKPEKTVRRALQHLLEKEIESAASAYSEDDQTAVARHLRRMYFWSSLLSGRDAFSAEIGSVGLRQNVFDPEMVEDSRTTEGIHAGEDEVAKSLLANAYLSLKETAEGFREKVAVARLILALGRYNRTRHSWPSNLDALNEAGLLHNGPGKDSAGWRLMTIDGFQTPHIDWADPERRQPGTRWQQWYKTVQRAIREKGNLALSPDALMPYLPEGWTREQIAERFVTVGPSAVLVRFEDYTLSDVAVEWVISVLSIFNRAQYEPFVKSFRHGWALTAYAPSAQTDDMRWIMDRTPQEDTATTASTENDL